MATHAGRAAGTSENSIAHRRRIPRRLAVPEESILSVISASIRFSRIEAELLSRPHHPPIQSSRINIALYGGALICRSD